MGILRSFYGAFVRVWGSFVGFSGPYGGCWGLYVGFWGPSGGFGVFIWDFVSLEELLGWS